MKKLLDCFVLFAIVTFLYVLLQCSVVEGSRRNRVLSNPQVVVPNARLVNNQMGGHDYYVGGKRVAYSRKNVHGSFDIYVAGRLKYKGAHYDNTNTSRYTHGPVRGDRVHSSTRYDSQETWDEYYKRWRNQRYSMRGKVYWWEHYYPQHFRN